MVLSLFQDVSSCQGEHIGVLWVLCVCCFFFFPLLLKVVRISWQ